MNNDAVSSITGQITLADGTVSHFSIGPDGGWQQWGGEWGGDTERLGRTADVVTALVSGLFEHEIAFED